MKDFLIVFSIAVITLFMFLVASWLVAYFGSPLLVSFGFPPLTMKVVSGALFSYVIIRYVVDFFCPKR